MSLCGRLFFLLPLGVGQPRLTRPHFSLVYPQGMAFPGTSWTSDDRIRTLEKNRVMIRFAPGLFTHLLSGWAYELPYTTRAIPSARPYRLVLQDRLSFCGFFSLSLFPSSCLVLEMEPN